MSFFQFKHLGSGKVWGLLGVATAALLVFAATAAQPATAAAESSASTPALIPLERFFQHQAVLDAKLSPSGKKLAVSTSRGGTRVGLVVIDLAAANPEAVSVAAFTDADISQFDWVGDNRLVFSLVDLETGSGEDRRSAPGLYAVGPDGSELLLLVRRQWKPFLVDGRNRDHSLEWNHRLLTVPLQQEGVNPEEVVIGKLIFADNKIESIAPMWLNVRSGRTRSTDLHAPSGTVDWMFDSKGQARVARTVVKGRTALHWRGPGETQWRQLVESDLLDPPFLPVAVDDTGNLYVTSDEGPERFSVLSRFDFEKGVPQKPALVTTPGFDFTGGMVMDRAGSQALGVRVETDAEQTVWFDEGMKRMQVVADAHLPGRVNRLSCRRCGADDMVVLVRSFSDRDPGSLYHYEVATKRWRAIGNVMDDIDPNRMATVDLHRIKARDGRDLPVWLTQPAGFKPGQPAPAVVLVHGGPWVRGGHWKWQPFEQFLASRGYLVISPEFRGSTGYGDAHYRAGWKQWGQTMQDDVADALLWAQKQGLASDKACIAGASYGGYSTLMGLVRNPELYRCGVAWVAVTDPALFLDGAWWVDDDISASGRRYQLPQLVGDVVKDADMLTANSPLAQFKRIKAPLLLAFGESDLRVPLVHGERLRAALHEAGRPPEWVTYSDEGHSWRLVSTNVDFARRVEIFLGQHLKVDGP
ncbi:MAG: prolyl oligopeptidase family serine peptidase [Gammaproteobacteria bacterium]|uniref:S9 family peptidase n=1 Tax=Rhodoferax sp. TaxID=50421 RepID=UPI00185AF93C|nr:prolyl oligopeptidase family serine peptidase [Rhodoferax sp.]MBU3898317.1 prolyl oligopeptidase family serine peptidase [Gammaproteobacteria bacterium]MBA3058985.1 S9 family peptidase [Rhodoferax sp.]MBU3996150.1 prolyl oligopeptidase family serine peptidase [Gammaproteobacteria bacterium]MBU4081502.1 prolyl oligopeptidase family serine peptidase [Gammaproteobacteria bacterium]MBU4112656.1 prolyl oligopeptidase family serine peptidase [Gammaproteobacteria bacterium]